MIKEVREFLEKEPLFRERLMQNPSIPRLEKIACVGALKDDHGLFSLEANDARYYVKNTNLLYAAGVCLSWPPKVDIINIEYGNDFLAKTNPYECDVAMIMAVPQKPWEKPSFSGPLKDVFLYLENTPACQQSPHHTFEGWLDKFFSTRTKAIVMNYLEDEESALAKQVLPSGMPMGNYRHLGEYCWELGCELVKTSIYIEKNYIRQIAPLADLNTVIGQKCMEQFQIIKDGTALSESNVTQFRSECPVLAALPRILGKEQKLALGNCR